MAIDLDSCSGCNACAVACQQENNIPTFGPEETYDQRRIEWMSMLWMEPEHDQPVPSLLPFPCQHCEDAPCVKVCPVGATYKDSENITVQVWDRCIGCRYCMVACPYGKRFFNWEQPTWDGTLVQLLNPDVATRPTGVVEKCTFCSHRIAHAREDARMAGQVPNDDTYRHLTACAQACPSKAITFGDLNDPDSTVSRQHRSPRAFRLLEHLGTKPSVAYLRRQRRDDE
ncbi:MAG TPA: 4Fe-4S dicluster domain-containing protein [Kofleriaceae bacterium]|nr:4Fe-4S dicluster domain-containing protein [Kofleriaceae bacterium]